MQSSNDRMLNRSFCVYKLLQQPAYSEKIILLLSTKQLQAHTKILCGNMYLPSQHFYIITIYILSTLGINTSLIIYK